MNKPAISGPTLRLGVVLAFVLACLWFVAYLWAEAGGTVPGLSADRGYSFSVETDNVGNTVPFADIQVAGVPVGKVDRITHADDRVVLEMSLDEAAVPLHEGAKVQVSEKSLAGQPFVRLIDGTGPEIESGTRLPDDAVIPPVTVRDVLASLDPETRESLGGTVHSLAATTDGRTEDISATLKGVSDLGRNGHTALDAIAAQSTDLESLSGELTQALDALDTGNGQIADLVSNANHLTSATAGQKENLEASLRKLPSTLRAADSTAGQFNRISAALSPVAADLRTAAPDLNEALVQLPDASRDLRGLLPPLQSVLDQAPDTLDRVPAVGEAARSLIPPTTDVLRDVNPAGRYIKPYGREIAQLIANFGASFHHYSDDGASHVGLRPIFTPHTVRPNPVSLPTGGPLEVGVNPYPAPGGLTDLRPFTGQFPRVERDDE